MKHLVVVAALALVSAGPAWAVEDTPENRLAEADRYLEATPPRELFQDMAEQTSLTLPLAQRAEYKKFLTEYVDIAALTKVMRDAMAKHFTADELHALADFYSSPYGKSAMKKFGVYMAEVMPAIQSEMLKAQKKAFEASLPRGSADKAPRPAVSPAPAVETAP